MKILSLFSGAGGLDLGLIQAGNEIIWANDIDANAVETYRTNIGDHIVLGDIKNIDILQLPQSDVVVGGFPCQGFSQANRFRMLDDERNFLYRFFYEVIKEKQPRFFIAENVKGILSLGKGEAIKQILADFEEAGYITDLHLVNMADYGVPEIRQRVIIVGQRKDLGPSMRVDIHTLFDAGHLRISPDGEIDLSQKARMDYGWSIPPRIVIPEFTNREFLRWRWENYTGF